MREPPRGISGAAEQTWQAGQDKLKSTVPGWIRNGRMLTGLGVSVTSTWFSHGLGHVPQGWVVTAKDATADVWQVDANANAIKLDASATSTINIWIW